MKLLWKRWLHHQNPASIRRLPHLPNSAFWSLTFLSVSGAQDSCEWKRTRYFQHSELRALLLKLCVVLEEGFMSWNVLQVVYWTCHSGVSCSRVASFSKLSPNNLVVNDSYMKWGGDRNPDFCGKYMVTRALSTGVKIGSDPYRMWISDRRGWVGHLCNSACLMKDEKRIMS